MTKDSKDPLQIPPHGQSPLQSDDAFSEEDFLTGGADHSFIVKEAVATHPNSTFDEDEFKRLLAGSISLTTIEKRRILESIPRLSQYQIDELRRIFIEERYKFDALNKKADYDLTDLNEGKPSPFVTDIVAKTQSALFKIAGT
ncbi:MAG: hypothetical protein H7840_13925 [Alphaproteobacteria bacterium]